MTESVFQFASPENWRIPQIKLWLSPVSIWEIQLLHRKKRIDLDGVDVEIWIRKTLKNLQFNQATLTIDVALEVSQWNFPHGDPADHFWLASARVFGLTVVTADERIIDSADVPNLANP